MKMKNKHIPCDNTYEDTWACTYDLAHALLVITFVSDLVSHMIECYPIFLKYWSYCVFFTSTTILFEKSNLF